MGEKGRINTELTTSNIREGDGAAHLKPYFDNKKNFKA